MKKNEMGKRIEAMEEQMIAQHGWAIRGVLASDDGEVPEFAYTVGLHERGRPELITFGVPYQMAGSLLNELAEQLVRDDITDVRLIVGPRVLGGWPVKFFLMECERSSLEDDVERVLRRSGGKATVAQVFWSDGAGRFPWERGFAAELSGAQPVLGTPPGATQ